MKRTGRFFIVDVSSPEEHANSSSTWGSMGCASSNLLTIQRHVTACVLRAQHGPTEQTQRRVLPLIVRGVWTSEEKVYCLTKTITNTSTVISRTTFIILCNKDNYLFNFVCDVCGLIICCACIFVISLGKVLKQFTYLKWLAWLSSTM